jgi:predicted DNA-binding transcriptional regulator AlpA
MQKNTHELRRVFRTPAAATYVGLTKGTLDKMRCIGRGPKFIRLGARAVGYLIEDLDAFIEAGRRTSTSDHDPSPTAPGRDAAA